MTCCSGSPVSSASETTKVASFSSSSIVGSALTSFSNCSSGRSGRTFFPSGPISPTAAASGAAASGAAESFFAGAFLAGAALVAAAALAGTDFWAGALVAGAFDAALGAEVFAAGLVFAACVAGALVAVLAWVVVVFLRAVEDTNTSRQGHGGRGKARCGQEPQGHSAMRVVVATKWEHLPAQPLTPTPGPWRRPSWPACTRAPSPATPRPSRRRPSGSRRARSHPRLPPTPPVGRRPAWPGERRRS